MMRLNHKIIGSVLTAIACLFLFTGCAGSKEAETAAGAENIEKPARMIGEGVSVTATVEAIDYENRNVTLKGPGGRTVTLAVSEAAYNFNQVKVGDLVDINYFAGVFIELAPEGSAEPSHAGEQGVIRAPEGQKPEGVIYDVMEVKAVVEDIDYEKRTVALRGTHGNIVTVEVDERVQNFDKIKKGDVVKARYTEAMAITVRSAE